MINIMILAVDKQSYDYENRIVEIKDGSSTVVEHDVNSKIMQLDASSINHAMLITSVR